MFLSSVDRHSDEQDLTDLFCRSTSRTDAFLSNVEHFERPHFFFVQDALQITGLSSSFPPGSTSIGKKMQVQQRSPSRFTPPPRAVRALVRPSWRSCRRKPQRPSCEFVPGWNERQINYFVHLKFPANFYLSRWGWIVTCAWFDGRNLSVIGWSLLARARMYNVKEAQWCSRTCDQNAHW